MSKNTGKVYLAQPCFKVVGLTDCCPDVRCELFSHGGVMQLCAIRLACECMPKARNTYTPEAESGG